MSEEGRLVRLSVGPTLSPCLILHEETTPTRTVLVYGTLPGHVECGEEAFIVSMAENGQVSGRCVAFSRARLVAGSASGRLWPGRSSATSPDVMSTACDRENT
ncbi:DUF1990 family protein [Corynebacterium suedekumii]|nr:DUF1990 family protein [Corynebacterium suedekumii]